MRQWTIGSNDAGQRLDRFLSKAAPYLSAAQVQKAIRTKHIKVDGRRAVNGARLSAGQTVSYYGPEPADGDAASARAFISDLRPELSVVFEDEDILVLNKPAGLSVHADSHDSARNLLSCAQAYLYRQGAWDPERENTFAPALCHRIDRHTGGLVLIAKTAEALRVMTEKFRLREIEKYYTCILHGRPAAPEGVLRHYLRRDEGQSRVFVRPDRSDGAKTALTAYRVLESRGELSLVECRLLTGRTHQIRAQWAHEGHPLLGDGKYGDNRKDRALGWSHQALFAHKVVLAFPTPAGSLERLRGQVFQAAPVRLLDYFHSQPQ